MSDKRKKRVRELQKRTGYSYSECLRMMAMTPEAREALIKIRGGAPKEKGDGDGND